MKVKCCFVFLLFSVLVTQVKAQPGPDYFYSLQLPILDSILIEDPLNDAKRLERVRIQMRMHSGWGESDLLYILNRLNEHKTDSLITYSSIYSLLGECNKDSNDPAKAIYYYTKSLSYKPSIQSQEALFRLYAQKTSLIDSALYFYNKAVAFYALDKDNSDHYEGLDFYKIELLKRFPLRSEELIKFYIYLSNDRFIKYQNLVKNGQDKNSYSLRSILEEGFSYRFDLCNLYLKLGKRKLADKLITDLTPYIYQNSEGGMIQPMHPFDRYYFLKGTINYQKKEYNQAWEFYLQAVENRHYKDTNWVNDLLKEFPDEPKIKVLAAMVYSNREKEDNWSSLVISQRALDYVQQALNEGVTSYQLYYILAQNYVGLNDYENAIKQIDLAIASCSNYSMLYGFKYKIYHEMVFKNIIILEEFENLIRALKKRIELLHKNVIEEVPKKI